jgi:hypothetical protein
MKEPLVIKGSLIPVLGNVLARDRRLWLRPLLIIGLLLLSTALPFVASQRQLTWALYLLLGVGLVLTFLRWPPLGLIVASVAGLVVPYLGPSGLNVTMILVALLLGLWLPEVMVLRRPVQLAPSRTVWPLLCFLGIAILSFGVGQLPWFTFAPHAPLGAQLGGLSIIVLSAGTFLLAADRMRDPRWLKTITWLLLALGGTFVVGVLVPGLNSVTQRLFQSPDPAFWIWIVALAFSQAVFNRELHPRWRLALGGLVLVILYFLLFFKFADKSGWIPPLVCIAAIIGFRSRRAGLVLALVAAVLALYLAPGLIASDENSAATRFDAWVIMAQIIRISPIWGLGFANYYWYTPLFPIRGYAVSFNSHNNYVDIVAQTGLVGLVCFSWFLWRMGRLGWRLREQVPTGFARAYVYGALGGLVGTVVAGLFADWVLPFFYNIGLQGFRSSVLTWLFLGGLASFDLMAQRERSAQEQSA